MDVGMYILLFALELLCFQFWVSVIIIVNKFAPLINGGNYQSTFTLPYINKLSLRSLKLMVFLQMTIISDNSIAVNAKQFLVMFLIIVFYLIVNGCDCAACLLFYSLQRNRLVRVGIECGLRASVACAYTCSHRSALAH